MMADEIKQTPAAALARLRWEKTGDDPHEVGKLGGRPRKAERCPCGKYTAHSAKLLRHRCPEKEA